MAGVVEGFRWALLGAGKGPSPMLAVSTVIALLLLVSGIVWFHRREESFVDSLGSGGR
jgi:lipopolysaccharide transport system permease protein